MMQTKEDLLTEFQGHMDNDDDVGGKAAIRMIFEVLVDIREGLINLKDLKNHD